MSKRCILRLAEDPDILRQSLELMNAQRHATQQARFLTKQMEDLNRSLQATSNSILQQIEMRAKAIGALPDSFDRSKDLLYCDTDEGALYVVKQEEKTFLADIFSHLFKPK